MKVGEISSDQPRGLRLRATYRTEGASIERFGAARIPSVLGLEGTVDVLALPSGLRVEAGSWRILWKGPGLPAYLLNTEAKTYRTLPEGVFPTSAAIKPVGEPWDTALDDEAVLTGTLDSRDGVLFVHIHIRKVLEADPFATYLAASLFVPGMERLVSGYVPVRVELAAMGIPLGVVEISYEVVDDDPSAIELPEEFAKESAQSWSSEESSAKQKTASDKTRGRTDSDPWLNSAIEPDPDVVETIRQSFLDDFVKSANTIAPAFIFPRPFETVGFHQLSFPWYKQLKDWFQKVHDNSQAATNDQRKIALVWYNTILPLLPVAIQNWAGDRMRELWEKDHSSTFWFSPLMYPGRDLTTWGAPPILLNLSTAKSIVDRNPPNADWKNDTWVKLVNDIAKALNAEKPNDILGGWFERGPGTITLDFYPSLVEASANSSNPRFTVSDRHVNPMEDEIWILNLGILDLGFVDVGLKGFQIKVEFASQPVAASLTTQPGGITLSLKLSEISMSCAFATRPSLTVANVVVGLLTGGATVVQEINQGSIQVFARKPQFDFWFAPVRKDGSEVAWSLTSLRSGNIFATVTGIGGAPMTPILTQALSNFMSIQLQALMLDELKKELEKKLTPLLNIFAFPRTLRLFQGSVYVDVEGKKERQVRLLDIFPKDIDWDVLPVGMRRFATTYKDGEVKISDLPDLAGSDFPEVRLSYAISKYLLRDWIESVWVFLGKTHPLDVDWASILGTSIPRPSPDPPFAPPPLEEDVEKDIGIKGDPSPKFFNLIRIGNPEAILRNLSKPGRNEPLGKVRIPLTVQVGWQHYKLVPRYPTYTTLEFTGEYEVTGETDSRGKPIRTKVMERVVHKVREWRVEPSYEESFLLVQGHIEMDLFIGLDTQSFGWPILRLAFELPSNATFVPGTIKKHTSFDAISDDTIRDNLRSKVVESLRPRVGSLSGKDFFSPDSWLDPLGLIGFTMSTKGGQSLMIVSDGSNNLAIGLRFVAPLSEF